MASGCDRITSSLELERTDMAPKTKTAEKPLPDVNKFIENVNKKDKVSGTKLRLPVTRRKRHAR